MCSTSLSLNLGVYINYIYIPPIIILLILGFLILFSDPKKILNRIYFLLSLFLTIWIAADFLGYKFVDPIKILWADRISVAGLFGGAFFSLFMYVFPEKEKIPIKIFCYILIPLIPFLILVPTDLFETIGPAPNCDIIAGSAYWVMIVILLYYIILSIVFSVRKIKLLDENQKKQFKVFMAGCFITILLGIIIDVIPTIFYNETIIPFASYAILIFAVFGAYAIVKYKSLSTKVIAAQALVFFLVILIGSQLFFVTNPVNRVLTIITLLIAATFGWWLVGSVKKEVERKEQLQKMSDSLAQANDQLRKLDNAKTEFISIASHQLRTPVTAIKGFASLLLEGSYGELRNDVRGALEKIYVSSERLVNLIEDLLNVSRIESGRLTFTFENASVDKILKELYDNFMLIAKTKKFYLDLKLPKEPLPEFKMDASKIRELISNFMDNALKYTEKGGVTVSAEMKDAGAVIDEQGFVKVGEKAPFGKVVRITVSDTGIGIPKEEIPYLFRKFSRGKDVSRLHVGGTGLGLYVGKAIADAHHGATWVESDGAGMGSRFIIEIPVAAATSDK